jgi:hypothetical protein
VLVRHQDGLAAEVLSTLQLQVMVQRVLEAQALKVEMRTLME